MKSAGTVQLATPTDVEVVMTRQVGAPRRLVWEAWTSPELVPRWMLGPEGWTMPVCEIDLRPSGSWHFVWRRATGTEMEMRGAYREIAAPERLVFTEKWGPEWPETINTLTLVERGGRTTITLTILYPSKEARDAALGTGMADGIAPSFDRLEQLVGTMARTTDREIVISRVFDAPRELVWEAWTNPKHVVNWWGPNGFTTTIEKMDVRPGGVWEHVMHGPDGTDYPNKSVFREVVKPERIVYSHGGGRKGGPGASFEATWTFEAVEGNKTRATGRMVFSSAAEREHVVREFNAIEGGKQTLGRLAEYLAKMA